MTRALERIKSWISPGIIGTCHDRPLPLSLGNRQKSHECLGRHSRDPIRWVRPGRCAIRVPSNTQPSSAVGEPSVFYHADCVVQQALIRLPARVGSRKKGERTKKHPWGFAKVVFGREHLHRLRPSYLFVRKRAGLAAFPKAQESRLALLEGPVPDESHKRQYYVATGRC